MSEETLFEFEGERSAVEAAALLRELADGVDGGTTLAFDDGDVVVPSPEGVRLELEVEHETPADGPAVYELKVELEWDEPDATVAGAVEKSEADVVAESPVVEEAEEGDVVEGEGEPDPSDEADLAGRGVEEALATEAAGEPALFATDAPASLARFEVFRDRADEWRWRLRHRNGNVIATSGEGYTSRANVRKGLRSVAANAPGAEVREE